MISKRRVHHKTVKTPHHGHNPITMHRVDTIDAINHIGDFCWKQVPSDQPVIYIALPSTMKTGYILTRWTINHRNEHNAQWSFDWNWDKPTLQPSLHAVGIWHGWVRNGQLVEA